MALAAILVLVVAMPVRGLDNTTRPIGPVRMWKTNDLEQFNSQWLQVKFVEGSEILTEDSQFTDPGGLDLSRVNGELVREGVVEIRRTFRFDRQTLRAWKARGEARSGVSGPDLSLWFDVRVSGGRVQVARLVNALNACPLVEIAHPVAIAESAVLSNPDGLTDRPVTPAPGGTPDFTDLQGYLYDPPMGLDAPAAWAIPGGRGAGVKFIDVEMGWILDHEDFDTTNRFYLGGDPDFIPTDHGTAVLGEVVGQPNGYGITGLAPETQYGVVAISFDEWPDVSDYFLEAANHLDPGDIWLIEMHMAVPDQGHAPMEYLQVNFDVIWTSVFALGVVCIEPAGNGYQDLDDPVWGGIFDRSERDSGAIMVAAGMPNRLVAALFTNYGSRLDVHAWGTQIVTAGLGDLYDGGSRQTEYTNSFAGCSGASAMVTGSAICVQGMARANLGYAFDPLELRSLLHDTGSEHVDPTREIGSRPNLGAAAMQILALRNSLLVIGPGPAYGNPPLIRSFPPLQDATYLHEFSAYGVPHYGVNVTCAQIDGEGGDEILSGAGPGVIYGPHVIGYRFDGTPLPGLSFLAYGTNKYGVNVAAGDLDNDGFDEIITGAGPGAVFGPHVRAFDYDGAPPVIPVPGVSYFAYGTPKWGVNVAAGDIDGDGYDEIVTGAGPGTIYGPHVRGWDVDGGTAAAMPGVSFLAYGTNKFGVNVTCGDVDGDGIDEMVTGAGPGAVFGAHVRGWNYDGSGVTELPGINFFAWPPGEARYGAKVFAGADLNNDGRTELVVGCGPDPYTGTPVKVFLYDGTQVTEWFSLEAFMDLDLTHGTNVAAGRF